MSAGAADHIYTLYRSPFALAPVIHNFYQSWEGTEKDILLSYLVLPLVTYKPMSKYLNRALQTSSIRTMTSESVRLVGLAMRVEEFKEITNAALLILGSEKRIVIEDNLSVRPIEKPQAVNADKKLMRYSEKLAMILKGESVVTTYRMLGLKSL